MHGEWFGFSLLMTLIGPTATLSDYELSEVATFKTMQACESAATSIGEKQLELVSRSKKLRPGEIRVFHLCVPDGS